MLRLTDIKLPLDHDEAALRAAILARLGIPADELTRLHRRQAQLRRAPARRDRADLLGRRRHAARSRHPAAAAAGRACRPEFARRRRRRQGDADAGHVVPVRRARAGAPAAAAGRDRHGAVRLVRGPGAGADGLPPDHPGARQGRARAHQGHLGPVAQEACWIPNPTCSSARAAPARSPTASSTARSATSATTAARCSPNSSRPARRRKSSTSASRTSAPSAWCRWSSTCARRSNRSAARSVSASASTTC